MYLLKFHCASAHFPILLQSYCNICDGKCINYYPITKASYEETFCINSCRSAGSTEWYGRSLQLFKTVVGRWRQNDFHRWT